MYRRPLYLLITPLILPRFARVPHAGTPDERSVGARGLATLSILRHATVLMLLLVAACSSDSSGTLRIVNYTTTAWDVIITGQSRSYRKRLVVPGSDGATVARYPPFTVDAGTYIMTATAQGSAMSLADTFEVFRFTYECAILPNGGNLLVCGESVGSASAPPIGTLLGPR